MSEVTKSKQLIPVRQPFEIANKVVEEGGEQVPVPIHIIVDNAADFPSGGGGGGDLATYVFNITPMLDYLSTASGGKVNEFMFVSTDDPATGNITSGLSCEHPDNADVFLMAAVGHGVGCQIILRDFSSDPSSLFGLFEVDDGSDQQIIGGPITWTSGTGSAGFWRGKFSFELSEDFHPVSQDEYAAYNVLISAR